MNTWLRMACVVAMIAGTAGPAAAQDAAAIRRQAQREAQETRRQAQQQAQREREQTQRERERDRGRGRDNNDRRNWPEITEQFSRTVRLGRTGIVDIETMSGDVTVTGGSGTDVRIEAVKRVRQPDEERARAILADASIDVSERPGRLEIRTSTPRTRSAAASVDFTLEVPNGADVIVKTMSGDVRVSNIRGELRADTLSGDLIVSSVSRVQHARTVSGDIDMSGVEGDIIAGTMSGDVVVHSVKARSLRLEAVTGDVRLTDIELERADIGTINGDIDYTGRLARGGRYELHTHSGDIRVTPAAAAGFDLEANTFNGDVVSEFEMKLGPRPDNDRRRSNRSVRGTFGDAGAVVSLRSFNGDITIVKR
jgi:DUF4097 and DUF4098 domain-containing protein YvlB